MNSVKIGFAVLTMTLMVPAIGNAEGIDGAKKFKAKCAACHGADGKGQTKKGKEMGIVDMTSAKWQGEVTDDKIKEALTKGIKREKDGKKQEMEALEEPSPELIDALIKQVRSFKK